MKKHINMKHGDTKCKICCKPFPNIKDALMHTANEQSQEIIMVFQRKICQELNTCKNCTLITKYKDNKVVPGPAIGTALHLVCGYV